MYRTPFLLPWLYPGLVWRLPANDPTIYLTFDDGPVPGPTEFVLDQLKKYGIKATFFCIGDNIQKHPEIFMRVVHEGHAIGNHTFNHLNGWRTNAEEYIRNTEKFASEVALVNAGFKTNLFRPPYGRITRKQIQLLHAYRIVMWDVLTYDYNNSISPERCLKNSLGAVRNGSIVIFHDSVKAERNMMYTLPRFIEACLEREYRFKAIS
ncbi:polysaccharide deacetylase family protein [Oscillatoria amoena NRMC-F 0135]|nr:polysaccharide deacetylase family protein [Oscillatoria amoena NRMC-F 0135]